tara:strand:+ start:1575 stop:1853 length:279 start_codon:yes stop_codon:yes gene_type:complete
MDKVSNIQFDGIFDIKVNEHRGTLTIMGVGMRNTFLNEEDCDCDLDELEDDMFNYEEISVDIPLNRFVKDDMIWMKDVKKYYEDMFNKTRML